MPAIESSEARVGEAQRREENLAARRARLAQHLKWLPEAIERGRRLG
jgi:hypothetical protein